MLVSLENNLTVSEKDFYFNIAIDENNKHDITIAFTIITLG